ncbi:T9SS type B sorting domain-containing protein [Psychroserpens sp. XS_ASV72]|uniref:T9SS type B sorting domain-containing protein n=1 Tax=Psychroserpens sp. XS_ASV72 TaxID=3241293 RepID=UPI003514E931
MIKTLFFHKIILIFCVFFASERAYAQLGFCQGNSGDPIFVEDFGTGLTNTPLPPGTTTYNYADGIDPDDGFYTVSSNTNYFDWFDIDDHTPDDVDGRMLVVNSNFNPGEFYRTTISGLCENTSYEFSAWIVNLTPSNGFCGAGAIPVNVRFEIWDNTNTNLLATGDTGNINSTITPNWLQYALVFQTIPGQTSVILKMINNGSGGCGNDLAIDDIAFKSCGDFISATDTSNNMSVALCSNETPFSTTITATPDNTVFSNHFYQWQESPDNMNWTDILGETSDMLSVSNITTTTYYRAKVAEFAANLNNEDCITFSDTYIVFITEVADFPVLECWQSATLNDITCNWDITGTQPAEPTNLECWQTANFNDLTCSWEITGTEPIEPTNLECWQSTSFNSGICSWEIIGTEPIEPTNLECWQSANFNVSTCSWEISGTPPPEPTDLECWETANFNQTACVWEVSGTQPLEPLDLECWQTTTFNISTCTWDILGTQPIEPETECWETAVFNDTTCSWDVTGTQPEEPTDLECWEITIFNNDTCEWEIIGEQPIEYVEDYIGLCENDEVTLQADSTIPNATFQWDSGETSEFITVSSPGTYVVISTDGCETIQKTITVEQWDIPIIQNIQSDGNDIVISLVNSGNYIYSLDGINYQSSPIFFDIPGGKYTIYIRHVECSDVISQDFIHFFIPKYFTPNGDEFNNTFHLKGIECFSNWQVYIFDRFGKLLFSAENTPVIWDGKYLGNDLPVSDYWYFITIDGQEFKGHFTLKR